MAVEAPKCKICGVQHWGANHIWKDEKTHYVATVLEHSHKKTTPFREKPKQNVATKSQKTEEPIRKVSIRELNQGISKHFKDLPFEVTKNKKVIARVIKP